LAAGATQWRTAASFLAPLTVSLADGCRQVAAAVTLASRAGADSATRSPEALVAMSLCTPTDPESAAGGGNKFVALTRAGADTGADLVLLETGTRAACSARIVDRIARAGDLPVAASVVINAGRKTLAGG
jgi:hypothetical protein